MEQEIRQVGRLTNKEKITNSVTWEHIHEVAILLNEMINHIQDRSLKHDASKLELPEVEVFTEYTPKLTKCTYGSDEYKRYLKEMKEGALDHHYAHNSHHPEHHKDGINDMTLIDIIEMLADWKAATMRHDDGDIMKSIEYNGKRFNISDQLAKILKNTVSQLNWDINPLI